MENLQPGAPYLEIHVIYEDAMLLFLCQGQGHHSRSKVELIGQSYHLGQRD